MIDFGPQARLALRGLLRRHGITYDAFALFCTEQGHPLTKQQVGHMLSGRDRLDAMLFPFAEALCGEQCRDWIEATRAELCDEDTYTDYASPEFRARQAFREAQQVAGHLFEALANDGRIASNEADRLLPACVALSESMRALMHKLQAIADGERAA